MILLYLYYIGKAKIRRYVGLLLGSIPLSEAIPQLLGNPILPPKRIDLRFLDITIYKDTPKDLPITVVGQHKVTTRLGGSDCSSLLNGDEAEKLRIGK